MVSIINKTYSRVLNIFYNFKFLLLFFIVIGTIYFCICIYLYKIKMVSKQNYVLSSLIILTSSVRSDAPFTLICAVGHTHFVQFIFFLIKRVTAVEVSILMLVNLSHLSSRWLVEKTLGSMSSLIR